MLVESNNRAVIGGNQPPGPIDYAKQALADLSGFLSEHPVISSEDEARQGKLFIDRARATLGEIEDERTKQVKPLNDKVAQINSAFKTAAEPLKRLYDELRARLTKYAVAEEMRRAAEAEEKRRLAELAEMNARLAEQRERDAIDNAASGELGVDLGAVTVEADQAFKDAGKLARDASRAEREAHVRIGGGFSGRSLGVRNVETLVLTDAMRALAMVGITEKIEAAILSAARDYRRLKGKLPDGVSSVKDRTI